jgi:hypothetical protein
LKDDTVKPEEDAPSAKAKHDISRVSNVLIKSTVFDETLRLERFSIRIGFLVTGYAPVNARRISALVVLEHIRKSTIN